MTEGKGKEVAKGPITPSTLKGLKNLNMAQILLTLLNRWPQLTSLE